MVQRKHVTKLACILKTLAAIIFAAMFYPHASLAFGKQEPTAIIVDNETGQPIDGAVALAQWMEHSWTKRAWWEGGTEVLVKAKESFSDKEGKIYIENFWGTYIFSKRPRLTVYKPGYALWDSKFNFSSGMRDPAEFNNEQRTIKLQKFDKAAKILLEKNTYVKYPHIEHRSFLSSCLDSGILDNYAPETIKIDDIFREYELHFLLKEDDQLSNDVRNERRNK